MSQRKSERWSALDLAEGLQLGHAIAALQRVGVLEGMKRPATAAKLARVHHLHPEMLGGVLEYLALRTELVRKTGQCYSTSEHYTDRARFLLRLYTEAYAGNASQLPMLLRRPARATTAVDRAAHARAFEDLGTYAVDFLPAILRQLDFNYILDLGCGTASLLLAMATRDGTFAGWGIERNPAMCRTARANIRARGLGDRIKVYEGDAVNPRRTLPARVVPLVHVVTASQFANEMFRGGSAPFEKWLRRVGRLFRGRVLVISDYYGRLGLGDGSVHRETLLHDFAQIISGQGVPPPSAAAWQRIYLAAGCRLVHAIEDKATTRFVHIVKL